MKAIAQVFLGQHGMIGVGEEIPKTYFDDRGVEQPTDFERLRMIGVIADPKAEAEAEAAAKAEAKAAEKVAAAATAKEQAAADRAAAKAADAKVAAPPVPAETEPRSAAAPGAADTSGKPADPNPPADDIETLSHSEVVKAAKERLIPVHRGDSKADLVAKIRAHAAK